MISSSAIDETLAALSVLAQALGGTLDPNAGLPAANLKYALSDLASNADELLRSNEIADAITSTIALSVAAGATIDTLEVVRTTMLAIQPQYPSTVMVVAAAVWATLACEVQIYARATFTSRQQVDLALAQIAIAFDAAEIYAADNGYSSVYQALTKAHAAIVTHLTTTARPLPKLTTYSVQQTMTSHSLSQLLYGSLTNCDDLVAENGSIHPAFMALTGRALSA